MTAPPREPCPTCGQPIPAQESPEAWAQRMGNVLAATPSDNAPAPSAEPVVLQVTPGSSPPADCADDGVQWFCPHCNPCRGGPLCRKPPASPDPPQHDDSAVSAAAKDALAVRYTPPAAPADDDITEELLREWAKHLARHSDYGTLPPDLIRAADAIAVLRAALAAAERERDALKTDVEDWDRTCGVLRNRLESVCLALKGPHPDGGMFSWHDLGDVAAQVMCERDALRADADRYRWLRDGHKGCYNNVMIYAGNELDRAVDAARAALAARDAQ